MPRIQSGALLAAVALAGCGGSGSKATGARAKVFKDARCGSCHTLQAAKSHGQVGPDLDQLKPQYDAVVRQVSNGGNGMPSFSARLSTRQIRDVAEFVSTSTKHTTAIAFKPDNKKLADCHGDYGCEKQAFGNVAFDAGPRKALQLLAQTMQTDQTVDSGCHQIAHEIGHAAYERYHHDAAKALGEGSMTCWSGYYHGVIERAFGGVPRSKVAARRRTR